MGLLDAPGLNPRGAAKTLLGWLVPTDPTYGAVGDCRRFGDVTFTAGNAVISSAGKQFLATDVGKTIALTQARGTLQTATVATAQASGSGTLQVTAAITPGIYLIGTELLHVASVAGSSNPYTIGFGVSNTSELTAAAHSVGETVTRLDVLVTTITAVAGDGSTATLTTAPTATASNEWAIPSPPGATVTKTTVKTAWIGTDNTTALQAVANAIPAAGGTVHLPPGGYLHTGTITWPHRTKLTGNGALDDLTAGGNTQLIATSLTADGHSFAVAGCVLEDIGFLNTSLYSSPPTGGAGVHFARASYAHVNRCAVLSFYNGIQIDEGCYYNISKSHVYDCPNYGIYLTTPSGEEQDHGDQSIEATVISMMFTPYRAGGSAVRWESGGGVRFIGNKINGNEQPVQGYAGKYQYGLDMSIASYASTVDLFVVGNSIENCTQRGLILRQKTSGGTFGNTTITGNEIGLCLVPIELLQTGGGGGIYGTVISSNVFPFNSNGMTVTAVTGLTIGPNDWGSVAANGLTLITVNSGTDINVDFGQQTIRGDNIKLIVDNTVTAASHGPFGNHRYQTSREIGATTSTSSYTYLYRFTPPQNHGATFEVVVEGYAVGVGPVVLKQRRILTKGTGVVTLATDGTDIATDVTAGAQQIELFYNLTATTGDVYLGVRLHAGGSATDFAGRIYLRYEGPLYTLEKGYI